MVAGPREEQAVSHVAWRRRRRRGGGGCQPTPIPGPGRWVRRAVGPCTGRPAGASAAVVGGGGAQASNSFRGFYLALLGEIEYDDCPGVPRELVLLPSRLNFSLAAMSSWTRTIVVPLSIISAFKPVRRLPPERG